MSQEDSELLHVPISLEELTSAIFYEKRKKSPGWDGIPPEFYLVFWDHLGSLMLQMILHSIDRGFFDRDANSSILTVLPKPNKDLTLCSSYRPLSILNADIKIYAKVLANRLAVHMTKLVHHVSTSSTSHRYRSHPVQYSRCILSRLLNLRLSGCRPREHSSVD